MNSLSLNETWEFRREGSHLWKPIAVPGCWEAQGYPKDDAGPYWYRRSVVIPPDWHQKRLWLVFEGASYHTQVFVNGHEAGSHTGMWDEFKVEITGLAQPGNEAELLICVEKPASLTGGPDSAYLPGRFPLRQTLSGFLPYVWGHAFGGLWQPVRLEATGEGIIENPFIRGEPDGRVQIQVNCTPGGRLRLSIVDPQGRLVREESRIAGDASRPIETDGTVREEFQITVKDPQPWSLEQPNLYTARLQLSDDHGSQSIQTARFGLRTFSIQERTFTLNGQPVYPRMALSWGWYPDLLAPAPQPERVRRDFEQLKALGFNGVKVCLWFPPQSYFDLADALGMLLWVELPLWLPTPTTGFEAQILQEYERLTRQARNHPAVVMYTLGCELDRSIPAALIAELYRRVKALSGGAVVRDNSGSGEAYGGWLDEWADFYDHHFYCDLQFLRPLLAEFAPGWRKPKPWVMGEFCDYDTLRDLPALFQMADGSPPWWSSPNPLENPQGARWEHRLPNHVHLLQQAGLWEQLESLRQASCRQGLLHRKVTLETARLEPRLSGYVVTGETDTPISTAGMWDELGKVKFPGDAFCSFNQDTVLLLGEGRRRRWVAGGDRVSRRERWNYASGADLRLSLVASHFGGFSGTAGIRWQAGFPGEAPFAAGSFAASLQPGALQPVGVIQFTVPEAAQPRQAYLQAEMDYGKRCIRNEWSLWFYPADPWRGLQPFTCYDPRGDLPELKQFGGKPGDQPVAVCTLWTREVSAALAAGGRVILLLANEMMAAPFPLIAAPFWREALKLITPHPAWSGFPHEGEPGLQFYSMASDCAMDLSRLAQGFQPLLRRLDTRGMTLLEYAALIPWKKGLLLATTLRLQGGLGDQPSGLQHSPAAQYLLAAWVRYLQNT